jgi:hypothetical protein
MGCGASTVAGDPAAKSPVSRSNSVVLNLQTGATASLEDATASADGGGVPTGILEVTVVSAEGIRRADMMTQNDCYALIKIGSKIRKTPIQKGKNPKFDQAARYFISSAYSDYVITLQMFDRDYGNKDDMLGSVEIPVKLLEFGSELDLHLDLAGKSDNNKNMGTLTCKLRMVDPGTIKKTFWRSFAHVADTNGDGQISVREMRNFLLFLHNDVRGEVNTSTLRELYGDEAADDQKVPTEAAITHLAESDKSFLHFKECPMTGKPFSPVVQADQYVLLCQLMQRMIKAEHGDHTVTAPIDDATYLNRGWLSCISEWKALRDSGDSLGDYSDDGNRLVKDRKTGVTEKELVPGKIWFALKTLYSELFISKVRLIQ